MGGHKSAGFTGRGVGHITSLCFGFLSLKRGTVVEVGGCLTDQEIASLEKPFGGGSSCQCSGGKALSFRAHSLHGI